MTRPGRPEIPGVPSPVADRAPGCRPTPPQEPGCGRGAARPFPFVSVIVPVLNEERYVVPCVASLLEQVGLGGFEILVVDGGSTDATRSVVASAFAGEPRVAVLENPKRLQSAAVNLGARAASREAGVFVRADAHALYPPGFVRGCVASLLDTGATSVVVPMRTVGRDGFQKAVAAAQNSRLGNGGSAHRVDGGPSGFVEHGHHAAFDRAFFLRIGGYDETFTTNEDAEFDHRALRAGGRIWMCREAPVTYYPRGSPRKLWKQYYKHGGGRARTLLTHGIRPRPRQLAPLAAAGGMAAGAFLAPFFPALGLAPLAAYSALCGSWAVATAVRSRDPWLLATGLAIMIMHLGWAAGFASAWLGHKPLRDGGPGPDRKAGVVEGRLQDV